MGIINPNTGSRVVLAHSHVIVHFSACGIYSVHEGGVREDKFYNGIKQGVCNLHFGHFAVAVSPVVEEVGVFCNVRIFILSHDETVICNMVFHLPHFAQSHIVVSRRFVASVLHTPAEDIICFIPFLHIVQDKPLDGINYNISAVVLQELIGHYQNGVVHFPLQKDS